MKCIILLITLFIVNVSFSQKVGFSEDLNQIESKSYLFDNPPDSIYVSEKTHKTKSDLFLAAGFSAIGSGVLTWFASRSLSYVIMGTGSAIILTGVIIKIVEKINREK